jgi:hypothetical protein
MPSFHPTPAARYGLAALLLILASAGVRDPATGQGPGRRAGITGVSNPASTVCARDSAGASWCTVADSTGMFRITRVGVAPGTAKGRPPRSGTLTVFNPDCKRAGIAVDPEGVRRSGGPWLNVSCQPAGCLRAPQGLLAYYAFDGESQDSAADQPNAAAPAALRLRGAARDVGRVRGGLRLDGDGWAEGGEGKNVGVGDFSLAVWVRNTKDSWGSFGTLLDKRDWNPIRGYHLVLNGGGPLVQLADAGRFGNYHSGIGGNRLANGAWHFLVVTVERASPRGVRWYLDAEPAGVVADPTGHRGSLSSASRLLVGRHSTHSSGSFRGSLDELQIYNRVLTPEEVAQLFARSICR